VSFSIAEVEEDTNLGEDGALEQTGERRGDPRTAGAVPDPGTTKAQARCLGLALYPVRDSNPCRHLERVVS
jgi:hypothetical protein